MLSFRQVNLFKLAGYLKRVSLLTKGKRYIAIVSTCRHPIKVELDRDLETKLENEELKVE